MPLSAPGSLVSNYRKNTVNKSRVAVNRHYTATYRALFLSTTPLGMLQCPGELLQSYFCEPPPTHRRLYNDSA